MASTGAQAPPAAEQEEQTAVGPWYVRGTVVPGFKRGSKLLGTPTANIDPKAFGPFMDEAVNGVYCCWAQLGQPGRNEVHKGVLSVGYNPQFKNEERTLEVYILHEFPEDFYGELLGVAIVGFLRPQRSYDSMELLKEAIRNDVGNGAAMLDRPALCAYKTDAFFSTNPPPSIASPAPPAPKKKAAVNDN